MTARQRLSLAAEQGWDADADGAAKCLGCKTGRSPGPELGE
jgi:hypothetical protein